MKRLSLLLFCLVTIFNAEAQQNAVTETGEEVILFEDGTWNYVNEDYLKETEIPINPKNFEKDKKSTFLLKSKRIDLGFWLNPKIWSFKKAKSNEATEYQLKLKKDDLYAMIISEKIEIPLESLKKIAIENGRSAAPDLKLIKEEYRTVNGLKVLHLHMNGTVKGIKVSYSGYYYSDEGGTIQLVTYTSKNLFKAYKSKAEKLLNGLVKLD